MNNNVKDALQKMLETLDTMDQSIVDIKSMFNAVKEATGLFQEYESKITAKAQQNVTLCNQLIETANSLETEI